MVLVMILVFVQVVEQAVEEGSGEVSVAGMDHQSGRLVDDDDIVVLVDDVERHGFGQQLGVVRRLGQQHADGVGRLDAVVRLDGFAVDLHAARFGGRLYLVARDGGEVLLQIAVDAEQLLSFVHHQPVPFKEFTLVGVGKLRVES